MDLRQLIARLVRDNPTWGEERIADELWLKLGIKVSPRTVRAYWPVEDPSRHPRLTSQNWNTFVRNHAEVKYSHRRLGSGPASSGESPRRHKLDDEPSNRPKRSIGNNMHFAEWTPNKSSTQ